jgi:hypothetical protein
MELAVLMELSVPLCLSSRRVFHGIPVGVSNANFNVLAKVVD